MEIADGFQPVGEGFGGFQPRQEDDMMHLARFSAALVDLSLIHIFRILTDGGFFGTITELLVLPACQGRGVGRALMDLARAHAPTPLYFGAKPGAEGFYEKIGCERSLPSFLIPRAEEAKP